MTLTVAVPQAAGPGGTNSDRLPGNAAPGEADSESASGRRPGWQTGSGSTSLKGQKGAPCVLVSQRPAAAPQARRLGLQATADSESLQPSFSLIAAGSSLA